MNIPSFKLGDITVKVPIIQGGMGVGVSLSKLAAAVANEGGIGIISGAQTGFKEDNFKTDNNQANINGLIKEIKEARRLSPKGIIGVNFLAAAYNYSDLVKTAVKEKVDLIISGAGLPKNLPEYVKNTKTKIAPIVSSGKAASTIAKIWDRRYDYLPDAIIVEGPLAGGHLGFSLDDLNSNPMPDLKSIVKDVLKAIEPFEEKYQRKIPVIAAGGIYTGEDIAEFLKIGAAGVQMASSFVATEECDAHINFKEAYINANEEDIQLVVSPVGLPGRAITNGFTKTLEEKGKLPITKCYRCLKGCNPKVAPYCITDALVNAVNGDTENGLLFVGANGHRIKEMTTVQNLMNQLIQSCEAAMA